MVCLNVVCCLIAIVSSCVFVADLVLRVVTVCVGLLRVGLRECLIVITGFALGVSGLVLGYFLVFGLCAFCFA